MENKSAADRSPVLISAGIVAIIVITLVVLGLFAIWQMPTDVANTGNEANTAAVAEATATPATATAAVTETTTTVVTATASAGVTDTTAAAVTTTAALSGTAAAAVTTTVPVSAAPAVAGAVDMTAVTAAVTKGTCGACHTIPGVDIAVGMIGPNLATIGTDAATRIAGYTAEAYLRESILSPNAFIAPKCPTGDCLPNLMLPNLADLLTPAEIDTIIGYLLTLHGQ